MNQSHLEISHCYVFAKSSYGKHRWFEGKVTAFEGDKIVHFSIDFPISEMKELGVCKSLGNWKAIRAWVDTEEGHSYIIRNRHRNYFKEIREAV